VRSVVVRAGGVACLGVRHQNCKKLNVTLPGANQPAPSVRSNVTRCHLPSQGDDESLNPEIVDSP
jgi:hypothetical protein